MNQGFLKMMVMHELQERPRSGYALVKTIKEKTGWKPSFGSIYPLLTGMESEGLVTVEDEGRSKCYTLTKKGVALAHEHHARKSEAHALIIEQLKVIHSLGHEEVKSIIELMEESQRTNTPPLNRIPEAMQLKEEMVRLIKEGKDKTEEKEIRVIFKRAVKELRAI